MISDTVILFSTQKEVLRYRKQITEKSPSAHLGLAVSTPDSFIEELWSVWGDGRRLITNDQRALIVDTLLAQQEAWIRSSGAVLLLAHFLENYATFLDDRFYECNETAFSATDEQIFAFAVRYEEALGEVGLIEPARALCQIEQQAAIGRIVVRCSKALPVYWQRFLTQSCREVEFADPQFLASAPTDDESVSTGGAVTLAAPEYFLLRPAGDTARAQMVFDAIARSAEKQNVVIASPDPRFLFEQMREPLAKIGFASTLEETRVLTDTYFGQAYQAVFSLLSPQTSYSTLIDSACSFVASPYAELSSSRALRLASGLRQDRTLDAGRVRRLLLASTKTFELFEALMEDSDASIVIDALEDIAARLAIDPAEKQCELAALLALRRLYGDAAELGSEPSDFFEMARMITVAYSKTFSPVLDGQELSNKAVVGDVRVSVNRGSVASVWDPSLNMPQVLFTTLDAASRLPAGCCSMVIMTELDSLHYSAAEEHSTLTEFVTHYDLPQEEAATDMLESAFRRVLRLGQKSIVFEYAVQSLSADEYFPAFFLEAYLDACKAEGVFVDEHSLSEASFDRTTRITPLDESVRIVCSRVKHGQLNSLERSMLFSYEPDAAGILRPVLSASSIEAYRSCPYKWFVQRKLNLNDDIEEFSARDQGTFVHRVFQEFYHTWAQAGHERLTVEALVEAKELFGKVFDMWLARQRDEEPGQRYVAVSEVEHQQAELLKLRLLENLSYQAELFPGYVVRGHEVELEVEDKIAYGGALIRGSIDRLDADETGNVIVVDYKGSLSDAYAAGFDLDAPRDIDALGRVQVLIYAQALRRCDTSLRVKGAVYLNYKAKEFKELLRGSLSAQVAAADVFTSKGSLVKGSFETYLDMVEESIARTIERMVAGDIEPCPLDDRACRYCPVLYCEKRRNGSY